MRTVFYILMTLIFSMMGILVVVPVYASASGGTGTAWSPHTVVAQPTWIIIPSIGVNVPIMGVGTNAQGQMAVPSAKSKAVGWYKYGVAPGQVGSAVLDAHVFAAFAQLKHVQPGADVYIVTATNKILHFIVNARKVFALSVLSPEQLFRPSATPDLNLITCAGSLTPDHSTYDHRLIVYATLVG